MSRYSAQTGLRPLPELRSCRGECPWSEASERGRGGGESDCLGPDDLWSRGKCGLKVLQYMAADCRHCNPVGVQAEMVRHGETGFLAETAQSGRGGTSGLLPTGVASAHGSRGARAHRGRVQRRCRRALWLDLIDDLSVQHNYAPFSASSGERGSRSPRLAVNKCINEA